MNKVIKDQFDITRHDIPQDWDRGRAQLFVQMVEMANKNSDKWTVWELIEELSNHNGDLKDNLNITITEKKTATVEIRKNEEV